MEQRTIVITGVSRGLGAGLVARFLQEGHRVAGCARSQDAVARWSELAGPRGCFAAIDVRQAAQVESWAERALGALGAPDLLVNNAGLIHRNAPLWEVPSAELEAVIAVNLLGVANAIRAFVPAMIAAGRGVVVNMSSGWGRSTSPEVAGYCATKWGIEGLSRALAQGLPPGLSAVALNPGIVHTRMLESCFGADAASYEGPEEWAQRATPFLLTLGPKDNGRSLTVP